MLARVVDALAEACAEVVVVRAAAQALPPLTAAVPLRIVADRYPASGPLAGLVTGLAAAAHPLCFATSCDAPLLQPALIAALAAHLGAADAAVPRVGGRLQPLVALYRRDTALARFEAFVKAGALAPTAALAALSLVELEPATLLEADPRLLSFRGVNTPADLATLGTLLETLASDLAGSGPQHI